jgi:DNA-binding protein H-NS
MLESNDTRGKVEMKDAQLEKMTVKELRELKSRIDAAIASRQAKDRAELKQKMIALAEEAGLSLDDVIGGGRRGGKSKGTVAVKYRHPDDASMTWTGRGRRPRWLDGVSNIEKFRV